VSTETASGEFTQQDVSVRLELNCGDLEVDMTDGAGWLAVTGINADDPPDLTSDGGSLELRSEGGAVPFRSERQEWALSLGRDAVYQVSASLNAADSRLDFTRGSFDSISLDPNAGSVLLNLTGAEVGDFSVSLNAGSLSLLTDAETDLTGVLSVNAGSIDFCAPEGTAARFTVDANVTFAHDLDESGLNQAGDTFTTDGFVNAAHQIDLRLEGNAASFDFNPEDGCE
jgi:hypothetical protein